MVRQLLLFSSAGAVGTLLQYLVLVLAVKWTGADAIYASAIGMCTGAVCNYVLNRRFVFHTTERHAAAAPKFFAVAATGLAINTILMRLFVSDLGMHYLVSQGLATGTLVLWNFTLSRSWAFRQVNSL